MLYLCSSKSVTGFEKYLLVPAARQNLKASKPVTFEALFIKDFTVIPLWN